jgi:hypothetical protein
LPLTVSPRKMVVYFTSHLCHSHHGIHKAVGKECCFTYINRPRQSLSETQDSHSVLIKSTEKTRKLMPWQRPRVWMKSCRVNETKNHNFK